MQDPQPRRVPPVDLALLGVLGLALALRLWRLDVPYVDAHSWRQVTNADIARHFATSTLDIFHPQVSWGGRDGVVGMEFPLLQWLTGLVWRVTGESAPVGRLIAILFSVTGVAALYGLGARLLSRPAALAAATLMAVSPSVVYFGRTLLSDTPMLTFMITGVWAWDLWFESRRPSLFAAATVLTALAALVKLPAIIVLAPVAGVAFRHVGWSALRDWRLWTAAWLIVAATAGWYYHADRIFLDTGLTQAVFRPSGTYPPSIAPGVSFTSVSHWVTRDRFLSADTWSQLGDRFWQLHLTAFGAVGALLGLWVVPRGARAPLHLWTLAGVVLFIAALEGQYWHEFHQLPLLPPLFLYFGAFVATVFDGAWRTRVFPGRAGVLVLTAVAAVVLVQVVRSSGVILHLYRPDNLQTPLIGIGGSMRAVSEPDGLFVTVEYDDRTTNSPLLLYFAHRQGWSFDIDSISVPVLEGLRNRHGAAYFATTTWQKLSDDQPAVVAWLAAHGKPVALADAPSTARLFDLRVHP